MRKHQADSQLTLLRSRAQLVKDETADFHVFMQSRSDQWSPANKGFLTSMAGFASLRSSTDWRGWGRTDDYYNRLPKQMGQNKTIFTSNSAIELPTEPLGDPVKSRAGLQPEYVVVDCRLENPSLLRFDSSVELVGLMRGDDDDDCDEDDSAMAYPAALDQTQLVFSESWRRGDDGWIWVPEHALLRYRDALDVGIPLSTSWFASLRYHVDVAIRNCWSFTAFNSMFLRVFLLPLPSEACTRVLVVTNSPFVTKFDRKQAGPSGYEPYWARTESPEYKEYIKMQKLVSHYMLNPMAGEWRQTTTDDAREEALSAQLLAPADAASASSSSSSSSSSTTSRPSGRQALRSSGAFLEPPVLDEAAVAALEAASSSEASAPKLSDDMTTLPLFPHQRRSVAWMHEREREEQETFQFPQARRYLDRFVYPSGFEKAALLRGAYEILNAELPRGGCVAHSVGAGKTVIATGLMAQCAALPSDSEQFGTTLVLVPNHIVTQWQREVGRFAPQLRVRVFSEPSFDRRQLWLADNATTGLATTASMLHAVIVAFGDYERLKRALTSAGRWTRLIVDEPQEVDFDYVQLNCQYRWALTATPNPLNKIMEAIWGEEIEPPFDHVLRAPFIRYCARRDPPGECLPVPPLHVRMLPVTLKWQESSVVQMEAMNGDIERSVRLCSYFDRALDTDAESNAADDDAEPAVQSLDQWVSMHRRKYTDAIAELQDSIAATSRVVAAQLSYRDAARAQEHLSNDSDRELLLARLAEERRAAFAALDDQQPQSDEFLAVIAALRSELLDSAQQQPEADGRKKKKKRVKAKKDNSNLTAEEIEVNDLMTIWRRYFCPEGLNQPLGLGLPDVWDDDDDDDDRPVAASSSAASSTQRKKKKKKKTANKNKHQTLLLPHLLPTIPIWQPSNDLERRIHYLSDRIRLIELFRDKEDEVLASTGALANESVFAAGDLSGVDDALVQRLNDQRLRLAQQTRTLEFLASVEKTLRDPDTECAVCFEALQGEQISLLPCLHAFCSTCVNRLFLTGLEATCPMCRVKTLKRNVSTFVCADSSGATTTAAPAAASDEPPSVFYGSKIGVLVSSIQQLLASTPDKIIVFGQWTSLLNDVLKAFREQNIAAEVLSTRMDVRCQQLDNFRQNPDARVLLLSSESQSSGINLDCANHVFIIHPYVPRGLLSAAAVPLLESQAFEKQAVGRVHRYPQSKPVHVYRLYARGSVEEELYTLCGYLQ